MLQWLIGGLIHKFIFSVPMNTNTYDWPIKEAADRAVQALHGLQIFSISFKHELRLASEISEKSYQSIELIKRSNSKDNEYYYKITRDQFFTILDISNPKWLIMQERERIWRLFLERYDISTMQLRANLSDFLECFNIDQISDIFEVNRDYFLKIPLASEFVVSKWNNNLKIDLVIPQRLMILDMILMFNHASECSKIIKESSSRGKVQDNFDLQIQSKLDAFVRQVLILGPSICEAMLQNYTQLILSMVQSDANQEKLLVFQKAGLSKKLESFIEIWPSCLDRSPVSKTDTIHDMLALTQIRNRLVHHDGRVNSWHAFQLNLNNPNWNFSNRSDIFKDNNIIGLKNSHIGHEVSLAEFAINTTIDAIDNFHRVIFENDLAAPWINIPKSSCSKIDVQKLKEIELYTSVISI